jgi:uncharacterized damage-inducible protein DinB
VNDCDSADYGKTRLMPLVWRHVPTGTRHAAAGEGDAMTIQDLYRLFDYGYWANAKLFPVIEQLAPEQFTQFIDTRHGSIRNTIVHMLSAEWGWLDRCGGPARGPALKPEDFATAQSVFKTWRKVESDLRTFLAGLSDADLDRVVEFTIPPGDTQALPLGRLLQHSANHGVHHRGQLSLLLRMRGYAPENFDLLLYDFQRRS